MYGIILSILVLIRFCVNGMWDAFVGGLAVFIVYSVGLIIERCTK